MGLCSRYKNGRHRNASIADRSPGTSSFYFMALPDIVFLSWEVRITVSEAVQRRCFPIPSVFFALFGLCAASMVLTPEHNDAIMVLCDSASTPNFDRCHRWPRVGF